MDSAMQRHKGTCAMTGHYYGQCARVWAGLGFMCLGLGLLVALAHDAALAAPPPITGSGIALVGDSHHSIPGKPCYQRKKTRGEDEYSGQARIWLVRHCSTPSNLVATATGAAKIDLTWTPPTTVPTSSYRVERCQGADCTAFGEIATPTDALYTDTGLTPVTTYRYRVRAVHVGGALSAYSAIVTATTLPDTTPPQAPATLTATAHPTAYQIAITWAAATDDVGVTGYRLERCQGVGCSTYTQIAVLTALTYTDTPLSPATPYSYRVRATDAADNLGAYSVTATATTVPDTTPPTTPASLTASVSSLTAITLNWSAATDNVGVTGYRVERCQGDGCATFAYLTLSTGLTLVDENLSPNTTYRYRVQATDAAGNLSGFSPISGAHVPPPPTPPTNFSATATGGTQVALAWTASIGADHYEIQRSDHNGAYQLIGAAGAASYTDTNVTSGTAYLYRVRAVDAQGFVSELSNVDVSTTMTFTDDPVLAAVTPVKAIHIMELRQAVDAVRASAGLTAASWTDTSLAGIVIKAIHIQELRTALNAALTVVGKPVPSYTDPTLMAGTTTVKAVHVNELRQQVK